MRLSEKWWIVVLVGVMIGLAIISFKTEDKKNKAVSTSKEDLTVVTGVKVGEIKEPVVKNIIGKVIKWENEKSELSYEVKETKKVETITLDSDEMTIFIPAAQHRTQQVIPVANHDRNWLTAFCRGDEVNVGLDKDGKVRMVFNIGYRMCGLKE
jgi:hypothetical protein